LVASINAFTERLQTGKRLSAMPTKPSSAPELRILISDLVFPESPRWHSEVVGCLQRRIA